MLDLNNIQSRMTSAIDALNREFSGLRAGRASVNLLDTVMVEAYGNKVPVKQVANITVADSRMLVIQAWDKSTIKPIEIAIQNSNLGVSTQVEGQTIRIIIPELSEERRKEICKLAAKYAEQSKVSVRNVRRDGMDELKKSEKAKEISEDESKKLADKVQKLTDESVKKIDEILSKKEAELLKI